MQSIGKGCTGLLYLNLSYCYITDSILRLLPKYSNHACPFAALIPYISQVLLQPALLESGALHSLHLQGPLLHHFGQRLQAAGLLGLLWVQSAAA